MTGGFGAGFFGKLSNIQDENRQQEKEFLMEDYKEFNKSLAVYRANKQKQTEEDNKARGFAMQISGDPRDTKALDVARSFISGGHNITDPVVLKQAQSMWGGIKLKDAANVVNQAQQAPGLGGTDPAAQQPGQAPTDTPAGIMNKPVLNAKSIFLGKSSPEQLAQKSTQSIAGRTGLTAQQVTDIKTGADTGRSAYEPNSQMAPLDPAAAMLMQSAAKIASDPKNLKDPAAFWGAISKGDYVGAGKFIASVEEQNAWHIKAAEIQAAATIKGHQITADAAVKAAGMRVDNSSVAIYGEAAQKLDALKEQIYAGDDIVTPYLAKYPGIDLTNPQNVEWIALQELKKQDTAAHQRIINGPSGKNPQGINALMDPRTGQNPPVYTPQGGKGGQAPKSQTDPYAGKGQPTPDMAKSVAEKIKAITDPDNRAKITKEYITKYGKDAAKLHGLSTDDAPAPVKETPPGLGEDKSLKGGATDKVEKSLVIEEDEVEKARKESTKNQGKFDKELKSAVSDAKALIDNGIDFETAVKDAVKNAKKLKRNITEEQIRQALKK